MKRIISILSLASITLLMSSCFDESKPNYQYFPDMYEPVSYETYGEYEIFQNGQQAQEPVEGTISRGWLPYDYENTPDGFDNAKAELKNPLAYTEKNYNEGRELYEIYCATCHGGDGGGKGTLVEREKILGVPSYDDQGRNIQEGGVYHVMYYGINTMGSYASQMNEKELWQVTHYVMTLKDLLEGKEQKEFVDEDAKVADSETDKDNDEDSISDETEESEE
ncbi:MAG: c-type cytochrome [Bacteroidota bacterium]